MDNTIEYNKNDVDTKTGLPIIWGDFGDEKKTEESIVPLPLGQLMILPDGRKFRRVKMWGSSG